MPPAATDYFGVTVDDLLSDSMSQPNDTHESVQ